MVRLLGASGMLVVDDKTEPADAAVVGLEIGFGGWGKEAMLIVFRTPLSEDNPLVLPSEEADRIVGTMGVEAGCCGVGKAEGRSGVEGERSFGGLRVA